MAWMKTCYERVRELVTTCENWKTDGTFEKVLALLKDGGYRLLKDAILTTESWGEEEVTVTGLPVMPYIFEAPFCMEKKYEGYQILAVGMTFALEPLLALSAKSQLPTAFEGKKDARFINLVITDSFLYAVFDSEVFRWERLLDYNRCLEKDEGIPEIQFCQYEYLDGNGNRRKTAAKVNEECLPGEITKEIPALYSVLRKHDLLYDNLVMWKYLYCRGQRILPTEESYRELIRFLADSGYIKLMERFLPEEAWADSQGWVHYEYGDTEAIYMSRSGVFRVIIEERSGIGKIVRIKSEFEE